MNAGATLGLWASSNRAGELGSWTIGVSSNLSRHVCLGVPLLGQKATAYLGQMLRAFVGLAPGKKKDEQEKVLTEGSSAPTSRDTVNRSWGAVGHLSCSLAWVQRESGTLGRTWSLWM